MKHILCLLLILSAGIAHAQTQVVPKDWIKPENLESAQRPLQEQLDTGKDMINTAWSMARIRDAELFIAFITIWAKLPANEREALRKDQETWIKQREQAVMKADDGKSGQVGRLNAASEHQAMTGARMSPSAISSLMAIANTRLGKCCGGPCDTGGLTVIRNNGFTIRGAQDARIEHVVTRNARSGGVVLEKGCRRVLSTTWSRTTTILTV